MSEKKVTRLNLLGINPINHWGMPAIIMSFGPQWLEIELHDIEHAVRKQQKKYTGLYDATLRLLPPKLF